MANKNTPFFRGANVVLKFYHDNRPVYIAAKNWDVEENATEAQDDVNGEDRSRLDKVTNFFSATVDIFQSDQEFMEAYMAAQAEDDAANLPKKQTAAIQIKHRDGTRAAYLLQEVKAGPIKVSNSSRQEAVMLNLKLRFRYWKPVKSI